MPLYSYLYVKLLILLRNLTTKQHRSHSKGAFVIRKLAVNIFISKIILFLKEVDVLEFPAMTKLPTLSE